MSRGGEYRKRPEKRKEPEKVVRGQRKETRPRVQLRIPSFRKIEARGRRSVEKPDSDSYIKVDRGQKKEGPYIQGRYVRTKGGK